MFQLVFFFNDTATTEIYTLSLHDALPILEGQGRVDLGNSKIGTARGRSQLEIGHDAAEREEMVAQDGGQPRPEGRLGLRVLLIEGLEPDFERAVPEVAAAERIERQQAEADADVVELEIGGAALF